MSWIALFFALEVGLLPNGFIDTYVDEGRTLLIQNSEYLSLETELTFFNFLFVGGAVKTYMYRYSGVKDFFPSTVEYDLGLGVRFKSVELGFRHYCTHPIVPWLYRREVSPQWEGSYEELYIRVEVRK